jgi:Ca2+-binding EF-hand superfamily protein
MLEAAGLQDEERVMFKQFVNSFRSSSSKRDMNKFVKECTSLSDATFIFVNPSTVRYSVREMSLVSSLRAKFPSKVMLYGWAPSAPPDLIKQLKISSEAVDKLMGTSIDRVLRCCCVPNKRAADVYLNILGWKSDDPAEGSLRPIPPLLVDEAGAVLAVNDIDIVCRRMQKCVEMRVLEATETARRNVKSMLRSIGQQFESAEDSRRTEFLQAIRLMQSNLVAIAADCDSNGISTFLQDFATEGSALCASLESTFTSLKQLGSVPAALDFAKELLLTAGGLKESGKQKKDQSAVVAADAVATGSAPVPDQAAKVLESESSNTADAISLQQLAESASQNPSSATLPEALALLQHQQKTLLRYLKAADSKKSGSISKVAFVKVLGTFNLPPDTINSVYKLAKPDSSGHINIQSLLKHIDANASAKGPKLESSIAASSSAEVLERARSAHPLSSNWAVSLSGRRPGPLPPSHLAPASSVDSSLVQTTRSTSAVASASSIGGAGHRTVVASRIADTIDHVASRMPDPRPLSSAVRERVVQHSTAPDAIAPRAIHSTAVVAQLSKNDSLASFADKQFNFMRFKSALEELYLTPDYGLSRITQSAELPSCTRAAFLIVGNGPGRCAIVEHYCSIKLNLPIHSHDRLIRVIVPGDKYAELNAAQAISAVPGLEAELASRNIAVDESTICGCTFPAADRHSSAAVFVLAPHMDGRTASNQPSINQTLSDIRAGLKRCFRSLREAFESSDQRNTGFIGPVGFADLLSDLNLQPALPESSIADVFQCLDLNSDGLIEYEEFLAAFRSVTVVCSSVVEDVLDAVSVRVSSVIAVLNPNIMDADGEHFSIRDMALLAKCSRSEKCSVYCYIEERQLLLSETCASVRRCREGVWKRLRLPDSAELSCLHASSKLKAVADIPADKSLELFGRINVTIDASMSCVLQDVKLDLARCCAHLQKQSSSKELASFFQWMAHWSRDSVVSGDAVMRRLASLCKATLAQVSGEIEERKLRKQEDAALKSRVADVLKQASSVLAKRPDIPNL